MNVKRRLAVALAAVLLSLGGIAAAYALTASTAVLSVCATASTPVQTISANGTQVGKIAAKTATACTTTTVTVPTTTVTTTVTVPASTTTPTTTSTPTTTTTPTTPTTTPTTTTPSPAQGCTTTLNAGADLAATLESAAAGSTVCLTSGMYAFIGTHTWGPGLFLANKSADVNVVPVAGASVSLPHLILGTVSHLNFDGAGGTLSIAGMDNDSSDSTAASDATHHLTFRNVVWTGGVTVRVHGADQHISFDGDTWANTQGDLYEGRLSVRGYNNTAAVGVTVTNSRFTGNGGCSDGVQIIGGAYGVQIGPGNEFSGIIQGGCGAHSDPIQLYGTSHTVVTGNFFHDDSTGIMAPDGGDHEAFTGNVFVGIQAQSLQLAGHVGTLIAHNTFAGTTSSAGWCGQKPGTTDPPSSGCVVRDNVFQTAVNPGTIGGNTEDHNLCVAGDGNCAAPTDMHAAPVYAGGASPATYAGYRLAAGSPGAGAASDGTDVGITAAG